MKSNEEVTIINSKDPLFESDTAITASSIYKNYLDKKELRETEKKNQKQDRKKNSTKSKKQINLDVYDDYFASYTVPYKNKCDPFRREQNRQREGNVIPEKLKMNLYEGSGFFFGMKHTSNEFVGKPASEDGHILVSGIPGSGKTMGLVVPSMMTWRGFKIIIDVKGDLYGYWKQLNGHTDKKIKVFSPGAPKGFSCVYDPFSQLRKGGEDKLVGNARDLALALMPLLPSIRDPVWVQATQNFLTGAIIYHFELGCSFIETMVAIQLTSIMDMIEEIMNDDNISAKVYMSKLGDVQEKVIGNIGMELSNLATLVTDPAIIGYFLTDKGNDLLDWSELNTTTQPFDVILQIPDVNLEQWTPMILLMINQLIKSLEQRPPRTYDENELPPVLVMLDEFPRLGKISAIKNGLATLRSRGVTFALFVQSLADLDETYGNVAARVIADTCAYKVVLCVAEPISQKYYSDSVGTTESTQRGISENHDPLSGRTIGYGRNINETREPIIYPHEFLTQKDVVVITPYGFCRVNKTLFVENKEMFLLPQLLQNRDFQERYLTQNPLTYSYKM